MYSIWLNGLSGSGKTTLANNLMPHLMDLGYKVKLLDGDILRKGLNNDLGFSLHDRKENIRRAAELNKLYHEEGYVLINSFITPTEEIRSIARNIITKDKLFEISLITPLDVCISRDPKGLYQLCKEGKISDMTGLHSIFEPCVTYNTELDTSIHPISDCIKIILDELDEFLIDIPKNF
jgi:adenylyl-sulfate kinase